MKALSLDLRQRIIAALLEGQTRPQVAQRFAVSVPTVGRLARQWREHKHLQPKPIKGRTRAVRPAEEPILRALVKADKNATLGTLSQAFAHQTGRCISKSALHRNLRWLEQSHKKSPL